MEWLTQFIIRYWVEVSFTLIMGGFSYIFKRGMAKIKKYEHISKGVMALLYDRLRQSYSYHIERGFIDIDDYDSYQKMYDSYHEVGGNGTGTQMLESLKKLPHKKGE